MSAPFFSFVWNFFIRAQNSSWRVNPLIDTFLAPIGIYSVESFISYCNSKNTFDVSTLWSTISSLYTCAIYQQYVRDIRDRSRSREHESWPNPLELQVESKPFDVSTTGSKSWVVNREQTLLWGWIKDLNLKWGWKCLKAFDVSREHESWPNRAAEREQTLWPAAEHESWPNTLWVEESNLQHLSSCELNWVVTKPFCEFDR
jgi:hypothetical protein